MAAIKYNTKICKLMLACDGFEVVAKDGICMQCKDRRARLERNQKEYARIQKLVAEAERNGRTQREND